jgi:hypothetical protein
MTITTKYLGATDSRGSRIKAVSDRGTLTVPYDHALNNDRNHEEAANALVEKLTGQDAPRIPRTAGVLPLSAGRVFIFDRSNY